MVSDMATWDDVRRLALALPQTVEGASREGMLSWSVKDKTFAWERPLRRGDLEALGDAAPQGPVLAGELEGWRGRGAAGAPRRLAAEYLDR
jgi:hypothetical protein